MYSKTLKQYSLELAAATAVLLTCILYLQRPTTRRFWLLLTTVASGLLMAYPVAFLLPGITLVVCLAPNQSGTSVAAPAMLKWGGLLRGFVLAAVSGGILTGIYLLCVLPNTSPSLRAYYFVNALYDHSLAGMAERNLGMLPIHGRVLLVTIFLFSVTVGGLFFLIGLILACLEFRKGTRRWLEVQVICAIPIFLLIICNALKLYPMTSRTSLFLLPAAVLLFACDLQLILDFILCRLQRKRLEPLLDIMLVCTTVLLIVVAVRRPNLSPGAAEEVGPAVSYLKSNVQRGDILWVHASCSETFKLYARMTAWNDAPAQFGHTGWPCCPRGIPVVEGSGRNEDVRSDLNKGVPAGFSGKVWLLYTGRPEHWTFVGADQSEIMKNVLHDRGCLEMPTPAFYNIGVSLFDCGASLRTVGTLSGLSRMTPSEMTIRQESFRSEVSR